jgi:hypothetical protein
MKPFQRQVVSLPDAAEVKSRSMQQQEKCPFDFNFDPSTFKIGDTVSYRIPDRFGDMPFVGTLTAVEATTVLISANDPNDPDRRMRGTRESRPVVSAEEAFG